MWKRKAPKPGRRERASAKVARLNNGSTTTTSCSGGRPRSNSPTSPSSARGSKGARAAIGKAESKAPKAQRDRLLRLNQAIAGCAKQKQAASAREIYEQVLFEGLSPTAQTFGALVNVSVRVGDLEQAQRWLDEAVSAGVEPGVVTYTTLLKGFCEQGQKRQAEALLKTMSSAGCPPNLRTANTLLRGCKRFGWVAFGAQVFKRMCQEWNIRPDATSIEYLVALLCQGLRIKAARRLLLHIGTCDAEVGPDATDDEPKAADWLQLQPKALAHLWEALAEASLQVGRPARAQAALRRASKLARRDASTPLRKVQSPAAWGSVRGMSAATALFQGFKEKELHERATLLRRVASCLRKGLGNVSVEGCSEPLAHLERLVVLPPFRVDRSPEEKSHEVVLDADCLVEGLCASFGLDLLVGRLRRRSEVDPLDVLRARFRAATVAGQLSLQRIFDAGRPSSISRPHLPLKLELCSGDGEWACAQAKADEMSANWACVELRGDRAYRTAGRGFLMGLRNLLVICGDATIALQKLSLGSCARVFVNFPEPPVRRGSISDRGRGNSASDLVSPENKLERHARHVLTVETFRLIHRVLAPGGTLLVLSDNIAYIRQLAKSLDRVHGFVACDPRPQATSSSNPILFGGCAPEVVPNVRTPVWHGKPPGDGSCGFTDSGASSYFDRLWRNGGLSKRAFLYLRVGT